MFQCLLVIALMALLLPSSTDAKKIRGQRSNQSKNANDQHRHLQQLPVCAGDCDSDDDCADDLVCFHRDTGGEIPGCPPESADKHDVCIPSWLHPRPDESQLPSIMIVSGVSPLPECWYVRAVMSCRKKKLGYLIFLLTRFLSFLDPSTF